MTQLTDLDSATAQRRARRDFIRTHHPDAGGNHDDFIRGLADFEAAQRRTPRISTTPVTVIPRSTWPASLTTVVLRRLRRRYQAPRVR
jgi:hypothetical protein